MKLHRQALLGSLATRTALAAFGQGQEIDYLANFDAIESATYSVVKDAPGSLPPGLLTACANVGTIASVGEVTVQGNATGYVDSAGVSSQCGSGSVCIIPRGTTFLVDDSINLGALIVRGNVEWSDAKQTVDSSYLCAGYVAVEGHGKWEMDLQDKDGVIYVKDNGFEHGHLRSRAFGSHAMLESDYPIIDINGREMVRTWSVLSKSIQPGDNQITLMHDANLMGWRVGDRIGIAPTQQRATGSGEDFTITVIDDKGVITLDGTTQYQHDATFVGPQEGQEHPALMSAEVVNLSRNIVISGDDFKHIPCDNALPEAVGGEQTSTEGCKCASVRTQCTVGLHTAVMHGGTAKIQNTRVERCGQRGIEGKYCLHFHKLVDCPTCLFRNNAIEGSQQRGIIVHGTHSTVVEDNVLYNVRGAGIYIEDGNEMYNDLKYNVVICPNPFGDTTLHGCTVPGTSNRLADTSDNHSGIFSRAFTNSLIGNRVANAFNGMFFQAAGTGRGEAAGKVCESDAKLARVEGNTWHGNGRFGTYTLGANFAKTTDQAILTNGYNIDQSLCGGFDAQGNGRGAPGSMVDNLDYHNAFVGHYDAGDIQHNGHHSYSNLNLIYWKATKNFGNGCSSHLVGGSYANGNLALPDQATFIIENTSFGDGAVLEANHHCNVGVTGVLCMPQYVMHNVHWKSATNRWMYFQDGNTQGHLANQNHGGIFTLSPPNAQVIMSGGSLENNFFPPGFVSLVSNKFTYLLSLPGQPCILSTAYGSRYNGGILCDVPLRTLKVYSQGLVAGSAPAMQIEVWYNQTQDGVADSSQAIPFHQIGNDNQTPKQGYSMPVVPGTEHSYRLSLIDGIGDIPSSWVVEFSDQVIGNRWSIEYIKLSLNGYLCGQAGLISSHHDRRWMWSGDEYMNAQAWCMRHDALVVDCSAINNGIIPATECSELCVSSCGEAYYCDCGSETCKLKAGFADETTDLVAAARCGENGAPTAKYLGGSLPVTSTACVCKAGWSGPLCQFNPCQTQGVSCGDHGTCVALSDTEATCECDLSWSGSDCATTCDGYCSGGGGVYPFGCNPNLGDSVVKYACGSSGGCSYLSEGQPVPAGFCTFREVVEESSCLCGTDNDCQYTVTCNADGTCPTPQYLPDSSPCNSVPYGVCLSGSCLEEGTTASPTSKPTSSPSKSPSMQPSSAPTSKPSSTPTVSPLGPVPSSSPSVKPTPAPSTKPTRAPVPTPPTSISVSDWTNPNDTSAPAGTYFSFDEADWINLFGPLCGADPCQSVSCGDHGTCVATSSTDTACVCDNDWSGSDCSTTCGGYCSGGSGVYPYGCNPNLGETIVKYGCHMSGGCNYLSVGQSYPYGGFCTFKEVINVQPWDCSETGGVFTASQWREGVIIWTGDVKVWPAAGGVSAYGRREPSVSGAFLDGDQIKPANPGVTSEPSTSPTKKPVTSAPTPSPSLKPVTAEPSPGPTPSPSIKPVTASPSQKPTNSPVTAEPTAGPSNSPSASPTPSPTDSPTSKPSSPPSKLPTHEPSFSPSKSPSVQPSSAPIRSPTTSPSNSPVRPVSNIIVKFACSKNPVDVCAVGDPLVGSGSVCLNGVGTVCGNGGKVCQLEECPDTSGPTPPSPPSPSPPAPTTPTCTAAGDDCTSKNCNDCCSGSGGGRPKKCD